MKFNKEIVLIVVKFLITYFLLLGLYQGYLHYYNDTLKTVDPITQITGECAAKVLNTLGYETQVVLDDSKPYVWLYIENQYSTIVNEGCNSVSIAILLVAFLLAFSTTFRVTFIYLIFTLFGLFVVNILRVAWLSYIYRFQNDFFQTAHDIVFPLLIYGYVVVNWFIWMRYFVLNKKKTHVQKN